MYFYDFTLHKDCQHQFLYSLSHSVIFYALSHIRMMKHFPSPNKKSPWQNSAGQPFLKTYFTIMLIYTWLPTVFPLKSSNQNCVWGLNLSTKVQGDLPQSNTISRLCMHLQFLCMFQFKRYWCLYVCDHRWVPTHKWRAFCLTRIHHIPGYAALHG